MLYMLTHELCRAPSEGVNAMCFMQVCYPLHVEYLINLIRTNEAYIQSIVIWEYLIPNREMPFAVCTFSFFSQRNQFLNVSSVLSKCPDTKIEHFCCGFPGERMLCCKKKNWIWFKRGNIWAPRIKLGDTSVQTTMDVVMQIVHCLLSDSLSLTLCYPSMHPLYHYWKKHSVNQWILNSFCFQTHPTSKRFVWPWPLLPGWWDATLCKNSLWNRRWGEACPGTWLPKLEGPYKECLN